MVSITWYASREIQKTDVDDSGWGVQSVVGSLWCQRIRRVLYSCVDLLIEKM